MALYPLFKGQTDAHLSAFAAFAGHAAGKNWKE